VLEGRGEQVQRLVMETGDLLLFRGRYSLHRVTSVVGDVERHSAILAYTKQPGVIGSAERTRQLFGRVLPAHLAAAERRRADSLLD
jgi:predicted 2-oxoglutarate/Fe(II)-dependent dioxygenase YbiX